MRREWMSLVDSYVPYYIDLEIGLPLYASFLEAESYVVVSTTSHDLIGVKTSSMERHW